MKPSLYAQYVREKYGQECIEDEHSFIVYNIEGRVCMIDLLFTAKEYRRQGRALALMERLVASLPSHVKILACEIDTSARDGMNSYAAVRSYGFEPLNTRAPYIVMVKYL
jgi:GNAT superfamily N-acetyltransferase